jgi:hypothetical protein
MADRRRPKGNKMQTIEIDERCFKQLAAFKPVVEAVFEEKLDWSVYLGAVLHIGLDRMLMDLIGQPNAAIITLRKLAEFEPEIVYRLIAAGWEKATEQEKAEAKRRLEECKKAML